MYNIPQYSQDVYYEPPLIKIERNRLKQWNNSPVPFCSRNLKAADASCHIVLCGMHPGHEDQR